RAFDLVVDGFPDVVQQAARLGNGNVCAQLGGNHARDVRGFDRVRVLVLAVAGAELQAPEQLDQLVVQAGNARLIGGALAFLADDAVDFLLRVLHQFFDARRVDPPVEDELFHRAARYFAANRVEAGDGHGFGRVVYHDVDAGRLLEGADIAPVAADDPPFHLVRGQWHNAHRQLVDLIRGDPLDGERDDVPRPRL